MDRCIAAMDLVAEQLDQPMMHWTVAYAHATQALIAGDVETAEGARFQGAPTGHRQRATRHDMFFGVQLMATNLQKGTLIELVPLIEQMATEITENLYAVKAALVLALADGDRTDEVRRLLEEFVGTGFHFLVDALWSVGMCGFAEGAIEVGGSPVRPSPVRPAGAVRRSVVHDRYHRSGPDWSLRRWARHRARPFR